MLTKTLYGDNIIKNVWHHSVKAGKLLSKMENCGSNINKKKTRHDNILDIGSNTKSN